jgi:hypothetical protein
MSTAPAVLDDPAPARPAVIEARDEQLHEAGEGLHWQESFYFNWYDTKTAASGLTRIGFRAHQGLADAVLLTERDGKLQTVYGNTEIRYSGTPAAENLAAGRLTYQMIKPLSQWRLTLAPDDKDDTTVDLTWTAYTPPFDFHGETSFDYTPTNVAAAHFEQAGTVTGRIRANGTEYTIDGCGHRDKSWGVRDWAKIEGWDWISAQFGPELAINATQVLTDGKHSPAGFVWHGGSNHAIRTLEVRHDFGAPHVTRRTLVRATCADGLQIELIATPHTQFPLYRKGLMIQESPSHFTAQVAGKSYSGLGIVEHTWHASRWQLLRKLPGLLAVKRKARS